MLLYENAKKFFADKLAADCTGHGRFESAFFHTIKKVHDDAQAEQAARIAGMEADIKTLCAALATTSAGNATLQRQRDSLLHAAKNLRNVKGRFHTEQAFIHLNKTIDDMEAAP